MFLYHIWKISERFDLGFRGVSVGAAAAVAALDADYYVFI